MMTSHSFAQWIQLGPSMFASLIFYFVVNGIDTHVRYHCFQLFPGYININLEAL